MYLLFACLKVVTWPCLETCAARAQLAGGSEFAVGLGCLVCKPLALLHLCFCRGCRRQQVRETLQNPRCYGLVHGQDGQPNLGSIGPRDNPPPNTRFQPRNPRNVHSSLWAGVGYEVHGSEPLLLDLLKYLKRRTHTLLMCLSLSVCACLHRSSFRTVAARRKKRNAKSQDNLAATKTSFINNGTATPIHKCITCLW